MDKFSPFYEVSVRHLIQGASFIHSASFRELSASFRELSASFRELSAPFREHLQHSGNVPHRSGNIPHSSGNIPHRSANIPHRSGNIPHRLGNIPHRSEVSSVHVQMFKAFKYLDLHLLHLIIYNLYYILNPAYPSVDRDARGIRFSIKGRPR